MFLTVLWDSLAYIYCMSHFCLFFFLKNFWRGMWWEKCSHDKHRDGGSSRFFVRRITWSSSWRECGFCSAWVWPHGEKLRLQSKTQWASSLSAAYIGNWGWLLCELTLSWGWRTVRSNRARGRHATQSSYNNNAAHKYTPPTDIN